MKVILKSDETLVVSIPETEDEFTIHYVKESLIVKSKLQDDDQRSGVIFDSSFTEEEEDDIEQIKALPEEARSTTVVKTITCTSCNKPFDITEGEVAFMQRIFKEKYVEPVRCKICRGTRKARRMSEERNAPKRKSQ